MMWPRAAVIAGALFAAACTSRVTNDVAESSASKQRESRLAQALADPNGPTTEPVARWVLPDVLKEISGIALMDSGRLLAHGDERGVIWELDYRRGVLLKSFSVGTPAIPVDLEGIARAGNRFFLIESNGKLHEFQPGKNGEHVDYTTHDTQLGKECEFEGVAFEQSTNSMLLACKRILKKELGDGLLIFRWNLDGTATSPTSVSVPLAAAIGDNGWTEIRPSDITVDPVSGNYVLVASQQKGLVEITPTGEVVRSALLPEGHPQPEGIAITHDRILILTDEAGTGPASSITLYRWRGGAPSPAAAGAP